MSPKSFIQFHQEGTKILQVQVRCPETQRQTEKQTHRPDSRGGPTRGGPPKNPHMICYYPYHLEFYAVDEVFDIIFAASYVSCESFICQVGKNLLQTPLKGYCSEDYVFRNNFTSLSCRKIHLFEFIHAYCFIQNCF